MSETGTVTKQWYVVHTYSGFENKVAAAIESRAKIFGLQDMIGRVVVPNEKVREIRKSKKIETEQKFFPGYLLVEMEMTDDTWHLVGEVETILRQMEEGAEKPKLKSTFQKGDKVRVIEGPFVNFQGTIDDLNPERGKLKVMVAIFGRLTSVELEYYQVERL